MSNVYFVLVLLLIATPILRKVGWTISKNVLYFSPTLVAVLLTVFWGVLVFYYFNYAVSYFKPNFYIGLIYGLLNGMYCANPAYALFNENTIPFNQLMKHNLINLVGILSFIILFLSNSFLHFI